MKKYLDILGHKVSDKVTGFNGVAVSVSFDLYGCIQVVVNPGLSSDGKPMIVIGLILIDCKLLT